MDEADMEKELREARRRIDELEVFLFAFVWNRTTYPLGKSLGKSEAEIAEKTAEIVSAASDMVDIARMRGIMEKYRKEKAIKNEGSE